MTGSRERVDVRKEQAINRPMSAFAVRSTMTPHTILVVTDEPQVRRTMLSSLTDEGYSVVHVKCAEDVLHEVDDGRPDLILLELKVLAAGVLDLCRTVHARSESAIIVLGPPNAEHDRVMVLDAGADDYLVKPYGMPELLARIRAVVRRVGSTKERPNFECSELSVDFSRRVVSVRGKRTRLTPKEFDLLQVLVANEGRLLRHRRLLQAVWGPDYGEETGYLRVFISQLRKKIEFNPSEPKFIRTEPWLGYRFEASSVQ